jgi:hypothetical protein
MFVVCGKKVTLLVRIVEWRGGYCCFQQIMFFEIWQGSVNWLRGRIHFIDQQSVRRLFVVIKYERQRLTNSLARVGQGSCLGEGSGVGFYLGNPPAHSSRLY